jgi:hypothetical protein
MFFSEQGRFVYPKSVFNKGRAGGAGNISNNYRKPYDRHDRHNSPRHVR